MLLHVSLVLSVYCCVVCYYTDISQFVQPFSNDVHLDCFQFMSNKNKTAQMYIHAIFVWTYVFLPLEYIPRNGIVRSYAKFMFNLVGIAKLSKVPFYFPNNNM